MVSCAHYCGSLWQHQLHRFYIAVSSLGHMPGQSITYVDALYTAVSALCVTGLSIVDTAAVFNPFGQAILAVLIQVGGLGVSTMGAGVLLMLGRKVGIRQRNLIHDTMNLDSYSGVVRFLRTLFATTVFIEIIGAFLGYFVFAATTK